MKYIFFCIAILATSITTESSLFLSNSTQSADILTSKQRWTVANTSFLLSSQVRLAELDFFSRGALERAIASLSEDMTQVEQSSVCAYIEDALNSVWRLRCKGCIITPSMLGNIIYKSLVNNNGVCELVKHRQLIPNMVDIIEHSGAVNWRSPTIKIQKAAIASCFLDEILTPGNPGILRDPITATLHTFEKLDRAIDVLSPMGFDEDLDEFCVQLLDVRTSLQQNYNERPFQGVLQSDELQQHEPLQQYETGDDSAQSGYAPALQQHEPPPQYDATQQQHAQTQSQHKPAQQQHELQQRGKTLDEKSPCCLIL
ncbi:MAG: hypothetical protein LBJ89_00265 [Holosporales bacterium]|jgi:hypothetical protein|nr:hypothetical protein [Holosporales bacterium]